MVHWCTQATTWDKEKGCLKHFQVKLKISSVSSVERFEQCCTDEDLGISGEEANNMRAECKALRMKSKNGRWCGDRRKWAEHRLMLEYDCMSKVCCHRDCIQCSRAQMAACPVSPPLSPLPSSFSYLPPLSICSQEQSHARRAQSCYSPVNVQQ